MLDKSSRTYIEGKHFFLSAAAGSNLNNILCLRERERERERVRVRERDREKSAMETKRKDTETQKGK